MVHYLARPDFDKFPYIHFGIFYPKPVKIQFKDKCHPEEIGLTVT